MLHFPLGDLASRRAPMNTGGSKGVADEQNSEVGEALGSEIRDACTQPGTSGPNPLARRNQCDSEVDSDSEQVNNDQSVDESVTGSRGGRHDSLDSAAHPDGNSDSDVGEDLPNGQRAGHALADQLRPGAASGSAGLKTALTTAKVPYLRHGAPGLRLGVRLYIVYCCNWQTPVVWNLNVWT